MTRELRGMAVLWMAVLAIALAVLGSSPASAATHTAFDPKNPCGVEGWFVNPDEADREPTRTHDGFVFEATDLIHHDAPAGLTTKTLSPGGFHATPLPDQPSFFSVEVAGTDNPAVSGYATLRYNRLTHLWTMVTGGVAYENADPDALVDMPPSKKSHKVVRFGVGYTQNPAGTVKTTVTSVSFQGKAYYFRCLKPRPTHSPRPHPTPTKTSASPTPSQTSPSSSTSVSPSATPKPSPSWENCEEARANGRTNIKRTDPDYQTQLDSDSDGVACEDNDFTPSATPVVPADDEGNGNLPTTGASLTWILLGGGLLVVAGGGLWFLSRRRRATDTTNESGPTW